MYTLLIVFFCVSIVFSFLCSIWEAVLLSITPSFTESCVQAGGEPGDSLQRFKANIDRPLAAILTLNTIAHTVGAIGVGAQATAIWGASFTSAIVVPVVMTLAILLLSEIIPKTIGANYWRELAGFTVRSLNIILVALAPLVFISQMVTRLLKKDKDASILNRADFTAMAELGEKQGVLAPGESSIMRNLLDFDSIEARNIMTPRTVVVAAEQTMTVRELHEQSPRLRFSRIPVHEGSLDHVTGYVLRHEVLARLVDGENETTLDALRREIIAVKEDFPVPQLFEQFTAKHEQIALVVDEFGGMGGLVSMEDVIETLLGMEIVDESDGSVDMQVLARRKWEERAARVGLLEPLDKQITEHPDVVSVPEQDSEEVPEQGSEQVSGQNAGTEKSEATPATPVQRAPD